MLAVLCTTGGSVLAQGGEKDQADPDQHTRPTQQQADKDALTARLASLRLDPDEVLHFEETRSSGLLAREVTYRGRLTYDPASGALTKWVDEPRPARLTLGDEEIMAQAGSGKERRLPLQRRPELAALLQGLRALLAGDATALGAQFQTDYLAGEGDEWLLHLRPRDPALAAELSLLEVRGWGDRLTLIDTVTGNGSRQSLRILSGTAPPDDAP